MGVVFNEEPSRIASNRHKQESGLIALVIRWQLAENEKQATIVLAGIAFVLVIFSLFLVFKIVSAPQSPSLDEIRQLQQKEGL